MAMGNINLSNTDITSGLYTQSERYKYVDTRREILDIEIQSKRIKSSKILEIEKLQVFQNYKIVDDIIQDYKNDIYHVYRDTYFIENKIVMNNSFKSCVKHEIKKRYNSQINFKYKVTKVGEINLNLFDIFSGYKFNFKLKTTEETKNKFFNISIKNEKDKVIITLMEILPGVSVKSNFYVFSIKNKRFINLTDNSFIRQRDIFKLNVDNYNILDLNVEDINYISKDDIRCFIGNDIKLLFLFNSEIENYIYIENFDYILNNEKILTTQDLNQNTQLKSIVENNVSLKEISFLLNKKITMSFDFDTWIYMRIKPYLNDLNDKLIFNFKAPNHLVNTLMEFNGHTDLKYLFNQNSESLDMMINPSSGLIYFKSSRYPIGDLTSKILNERWILFQSTNLTDILVDLELVDLKT